MDELSLTGVGRMLLVDIDGAEEAELLRLRGAPVLDVPGSFVQLMYSINARQYRQVCMR